MSDIDQFSVTINRTNEGMRDDPYVTISAKRVTLGPDGILVIQGWDKAVLFPLVYGTVLKSSGYLQRSMAPIPRGAHSDPHATAVAAMSPKASQRPRMATSRA
jgi:AMMECR1 domain-containing protein